MLQPPRQAGVLEITPEMIAAGVKAYSTSVPDDPFAILPREEIVRQILVQALAALHPASPPSNRSTR